MADRNRRLSSASKWCSSLGWNMRILKHSWHRAIFQTADRETIPVRCQLAMIYPLCLRAKFLALQMLACLKDRVHPDWKRGHVMVFLLCKRIWHVDRYSRVIIFQIRIESRGQAKLTIYAFIRWSSISIHFCIKLLRKGSIQKLTGFTCTKLFALNTSLII